jgi:TrmH family RNA methyltransferase
MTPQDITSRDNPLVRELRAIARSSTAYREHGRVWLDGEHLGRALLARGGRPEVAVFTESAWLMADDALRSAAERVVRVPDPLMAQISGLDSPPPMGFAWQPPPAAALSPGLATVVLDRLQDAGNVGTILRSAAAFGFTQVAALRETAALWSPKVLRAGMGAHFALRLVEGVAAADLDALGVPLLVTSSHAGEPLHAATLPWPCAWVFGQEGRGIEPGLAARAARRVRIVQPGGQESLNVAAAAAICLHASAVVGSRT